MMSLLKLGKSRPTEPADNGRRSFFWKMGAGVSTALASTAGLAGVRTGGADDALLQAALLREEKSLRKLHQSFEQAIDKGLYEDVVGMFADNAEVVFNGGIFRHGSGVSRLFRERFRSGKTGTSMEAAPGYELAAEQQPDSVKVSPDRLSARAAFPYSIRVGMPIESDSSLLGMARLHGEGIETWWEGGVYDVGYVRNVVDDRWKIGRLEYRTLARADYRSGRTYAKPIAVSPLAVRYPEDPQGPDALV